MFLHSAGGVQFTNTYHKASRDIYAKQKRCTGLVSILEAVHGVQKSSTPSALAAGGVRRGVLKYQESTYGAAQVSTHVTPKMSHNFFYSLDQWNLACLLLRESCSTEKAFVMSIAYLLCLRQIE